MNVNYFKKNSLIEFKKSYGIGIITAKKIIKKIGLNFSNKKAFLNTAQFNRLTKLNKNIIVNKKLKNELKEIILFPQKIRTYKGLRNKYNYPCRGQRTRTNAKTKKKIKIQI